MLPLRHYNKLHSKKDVQCYHEITKQNVCLHFTMWFKVCSGKNPQIKWS